MSRKFQHGTLQLRQKKNSAAQNCCMKGVWLLLANSQHNPPFSFHPEKVVKQRGGEPFFSSAFLECGSERY